jgi:hypothetical protein
VSGDPSAEPEPLPREGVEEGRLDGRADGVSELSGGASQAAEDGSQSIDGASQSIDGAFQAGAPIVSITLSRNQVNHVVHAVLGDDADPGMPVLLAGSGVYRSRVREALSARYRALQDNRRLSRSLLSGLLVLSCFPQDGVDLGIKDISQELKLNTSTVHRYVLTLVAAGLLERDPDTRRYRLLAR